MANLFPGATRSSKVKVKDFITDGNWNLKLRTIFPEQFIHPIKDIDIGQSDQDDYATWNSSHDGQFSNVTAWENIRVSRKNNILLSKVWHSSIPFKMSFLLWRLLLCKLPFDEVLARFGNQTVSRCACCTRPNSDDLHHVFIESEIANYLWKCFGGPLGIRHLNWPIKRILMEWWDTKPKNIWKNWAACKYGHQKRKILSKMEFQVNWNIKTALSMAFPKCIIEGNWQHMCDIIEKLRPIVIWRQVAWSKPSDGRLKVNTDGSFFSGNGNTGIGGIIRNEAGDLLMAFSIPIQCNSNNQAEALAALHVRWCKQNNFCRCDLELDSQLVSDMISNGDTNNLKLKRLIGDIVHITSQVDVQVMHCFREANQVADYLAKLASQSRNSTSFTSFNQLPREVKGLFQLDRWQLPSIRRRFDQANFFVS